MELHLLFAMWRRCSVTRFGFEVLRRLSPLIALVSLGLFVYSGIFCLLGSFSDCFCYNGVVLQLISLAPFLWLPRFGTRFERTLHGLSGVIYLLMTDGFLRRFFQFKALEFWMSFCNVIKSSHSLVSVVLRWPV